MSQFEIEDGIPVAPRASGPRTGKYPFRTMEVNQSFLVPADVKAATIRSAIGAFNKKNKDRKFAVRTTESGTRVWRVE